jgi:hypothetical protein
MTVPLLVGCAFAPCRELMPRGPSGGARDAWCSVAFVVEVWLFVSLQVRQQPAVAGVFALAVVTYTVLSVDVAYVISLGCHNGCARLLLCML